MSIYLDCNATTPIEKEVNERITYFLVEEFGNEGSIEINNNYFLLSHSTYLPSDRYYKDIYDKIIINRFSGKFHYREQDEFPRITREFEGTCEKVTDKKL